MGRTPGGKPFTALKIRGSFKTGLYADAGCSGLYLQVSAFGTKAWVFRYVRGKKETKNGKKIARGRKMGLGPVSIKDNDGNITLAEARSMATDARKLVVQGDDPIEIRAKRRTAQALEAAKTITFKVAAERYIEAKRSGWKSDKHGKQWASTLLTYAFPKIGHLPVASIDTTLVLQILQQKIKRKEREGTLWEVLNETASRLRARIETVLAWAESRGFRQGDNPAALKILKFSLPEKSQIVQHHPALPYAELPAFMAQLRAKEGIGARALEFLVLTGVRTNDVIGAPRGEINKADRLWTIPAARLKGKKGHRKRDHVVPLSDQALAILEALPTEGQFIFPGGKLGKPLSNAAMAAVVDRMNEDNEAIGKPKWLDPKSGREIVPHGFRSTFMDWGHDVAGYDKEIMDLATAHVVSDKVEAAYRRSDMRERRRRLMADWAAYCGGKAVGGNNVVKLARAK